MIAKNSPIPKPQALAAARPEQKIVLPILAELLPRGDGTFILKPRVAGSSLDSWISPARASEIIGLKGRSIYRLLDAEEPLLVHKRPLKSKILISLKSVNEFVRATSDPGFWTDPLVQEPLRRQVRQALEALRQP